MPSYANKSEALKQHIINPYMYDMAWQHDCQKTGDPSKEKARLWV